MTEKFTGKLRRIQRREFACPFPKSPITYRTFFSKTSWIFEMISCKQYTRPISPMIGLVFSNLTRILLTLVALLEKSTPISEQGICRISIRWLGWPRTMVTTEKELLWKDIVQKGVWETILCTARLPSTQLPNYGATVGHSNHTWNQMLHHLGFVHQEFWCDNVVIE